ncbi:ankyrin repeat-containing domain protein [Tuber indicum]|nr:ankyrin repeat-containing domain protein [Tuber indicum]
MSFLTLPNELFLEISSWLSLADQNSLFRTNRRLAGMLPGVLIDTVFRAQDKEHGRRVLCAFASLKDNATVGAFLDRGILSFVGTGPNVIRCAMETENVTTVQTLLDCGVSADDTDDSGWTPIHYAAITGSAGMMRVLLSKAEYGIDVNMSWGDVSTPLIYATVRGFTEVVSVLLRHHSIEVNWVGPEGCSALQYAIWYEMIGILDLLLADSRADINTPNGTAMTPFMCAIRSGRKESLKRLLQNPRLDVSWGSPDDDPPLHAAIYNGDATILMMLLKDERINVHSVDASGSTALHEACAFREDLVQVLLEDGRADVNARNRSGCTPLHVAVRAHKETIVSQLLQDFRIDILAKDNQEQTALCLARRVCGGNIVRLIEEQHKGTSERA